MIPDLTVNQDTPLQCECICFNPTLSSRGNIEWNRVQTRKELAYGWGPGYTEPSAAEEEAEKALNPGWGQWLLAIVGIGQEKKEPKPDSTLDPNWKPEFC